MDNEEFSLEEKCENLMNEVVHYRKQFGKACVNYDKRTLDMEIKLLALESKTASNYRPKPKITAPSHGLSTKDMNDFLVEVAEREQRIENLQERLKNTNKIVTQLINDTVSKKLRDPLTVVALAATAKTS